MAVNGPVDLHSTLMSVREPGARTNWLSLPMRDLMKVWDSVMSISPALLSKFGDCCKLSFLLTLIDMDMNLFNYMSIPTFD